VITCFLEIQTISVFVYPFLLAPLPILEYVIIHELAHLIEPNHSRRFWNIVKSIDPHYKKKKKWINENGNSLNL